MNYQPFVDDKFFWGGNISTFFLVTFIVVVLAIGLAAEIWRRLRQNEVMKYEFITILAHKFRTPLTHLKWQLEELSSSSAEPAAKEMIADISGSIDQLISLTGTMLELTDSENKSKTLYKFERVSLCDFVKNVTQPFKNMFHEKNISFSVRCEGQEVFARIDKPRMEFVLHALLENSHAYTPPGRNIDIIVSQTWHKAMISIKDAGIGIESKDLPHIFEKFYRAENARRADMEGVGIGLFLAQSIVRRHKGKIEVYSEGRDRGTLFRVVLPRE